MENFFWSYSGKTPKIFLLDKENSRFIFEGFIYTKEAIEKLEELSFGKKCESTSSYAKNTTTKNNHHEKELSHET